MLHEKCIYFPKDKYESCSGVWETNLIDLDEQWKVPELQEADGTKSATSQKQVEVFGYCLTLHEIWGTTAVGAKWNTFIRGVNENPSKRCIKRGKLCPGTRFRNFFSISTHICIQIERLKSTSSSWPFNIWTVSNREKRPKEDFAAWVYQKGPY